MQFRHCHLNGLYWHPPLILYCDFLHLCYSRKACAIYSTSPSLYFLSPLSQTDLEVYIRKITAHYFVILIQVEQGFHIFKPRTKTSGTCFCEVNSEVHNHNSVIDFQSPPHWLCFLLWHTWAKMAKYHHFINFLAKKHYFETKWGSITFSGTRAP